LADHYDSLTHSQLVNLLRKRDSEKKLGLVWERDEIEADAAIDANFVACTLDPGLSDGAAPWRNLVIEGDNFDALRWLRMTHARRVKCIYIDPPYNTGNKDWVYNDHYIEPSDRYRHSTWLEFLFRRLELARDLLSSDGVILVSINDENRAKLELLMDEVFTGMRVGSLVWRTKDSSNDAGRNFSSVHEHVLVYGNRDFSFLGYLLERGKYSNPDNDPRGDYSRDPITKGHSFKERDGTYYPIQDPKTGWWYPCNPESVWRYASETRLKGNRRIRTETIESLIRDDRIIFSATESVTYHSMDEILEVIRNGMGPVDGKGRPLFREDLPDLDFWIGKPIGLGRPSQKAFWEEKQTKYKPVSSYIFGGRETPQEDFYVIESDKQGVASDEVQEIFGGKVFTYPKPVKLIRSLVEAVADQDEIVLDFFAGSATTAHAVMELNAEDNGSRRFIMVSSAEATNAEPDKNICRDVTAERIRRLNALKTGKYASLSAEFAYLRTREIDFDALNSELEPAEAWNALEAMHGLPLTPYDEAPGWNEHGDETLTLVLADRTEDSLIDRLRELAAAKANVFIYSWAPGQVRTALGSADCEILPVRETLVKRFMA
jgi:adenine-specific DNA-methyltransferase